MNKQPIRILVLAALMTALCAVMTSVIRVPSPMGGYLNLGDCAVLLSGWLLGPVWGAAAAGVGSALSDLLGYPLYAPATLVIKGVMGGIAGLLFSVERNNTSAHPLRRRLTGGILAECIMVGGYLLFESVLLGMGPGAAANVPFNVIQGLFGVASAALVMEALSRGRGALRAAE